MLNNPSQINHSPDAQLVIHSLGGDTNAFTEIVSRYQNLICSIAYSGLGDIKLSEDVAQETFIEAWQKLANLQQPEKLKSWLCGIARFKVSHYRRKASNKVIDQGADIEQVDLAQISSQHTENTVIDEQHQALLWQVLQQVDETYREPLVLYYRSHGSVADVAAELALSEDLVKQRLSRGRKVLKQTMLAFIETTLKSSKPSVVFTTSVMAVISSLPAPVKAAGIVTGSIKTGSSASVSNLTSLLAPLAGVVSSWFGLQASLAQTRTEKERKLTIKAVLLFVLMAGFFSAGLWLLNQLAVFIQPGQQGQWLFLLVAQVAVIGFIWAYVKLGHSLFNQMKTLRYHERIFNPERFQSVVDEPGASKRYYRSKLSLFGIPLVHVQLGMHEQGEAPVVGWVAAGSQARGVLFAWGGVAIAPIAIGIFSIGFISIGAIGIGVFSSGAVAVGLLAFGAAALGYQAYGALSATAWNGAFSGGFALAKEGAIGSIAQAKQVNNDLAAQLIQLDGLTQIHPWLLLLISVLVVVPAAYYAKTVKRKMANN